MKAVVHILTRLNKSLVLWTYRCIPTVRNNILPSSSAVIIEIQTVYFSESLASTSSHGITIYKNLHGRENFKSQT